MNDRSERWSRVGGCVKRAALLAIGLAALVGICSWFSSRSAERRLAAEIAAARAEGLPTEYKDLYRNPPLKPDEDAGPIYLEAVAKCPVFKADLRTVKDLSGPYILDAATEAEKHEIRAALRKVEPALALMRKGSRKPHCDFHRPWNRGWNVMFPDLATIKPLSFALAAHAVSAAADGRGNLAVEDLVALANIYRHLAEQPSLIETLVAGAVLLECEGVTERVITMLPRNAGIAAALQRVSDALGPSEPLGRSIAGNIPSVRDYLDATAQGSTDEVLHSPEVATLARMPGIRHEAERQIVARARETARQFRLSATDYLTAHDALNRLETRPTPLDDLAGHLADQLGAFGPGTRLLESYAGWQTRRRLIACAASVFSVWQRTGVRPFALPSKGIDANDPFTNGPLAYVTTTTGFKIYSVGPDGIDDKGARKDPNVSYHQSYDLAFEYPAPPLPRYKPSGTYRSSSLP